MRNLLSIQLHFAFIVAQAYGSRSASWSNWSQSTIHTSILASSSSTAYVSSPSSEVVASYWSTWSSSASYTSTTATTTSSSHTFTLTAGALTTSCSRPVPSATRSIALTSATILQPSTVSCPSVQASNPIPGNGARAQAVRDAYVRSWDQYATYCFGRDSLFVVNNTCIDDFGGWGVTIVDALDTAIIMNLTDIVSSQLAHIAAIDFTVSQGKQPVNAFETTIRYLGGLLSSYDLLKSGFVDPGTYNEEHIELLLKQAVVLADQLQSRFQTPTGLPAEKLFWSNKTYPIDTFDNDINNVTYNASNAAVCGTFILEYYRLSDLTGDASYRATADRVEQYLITSGDEYQPAFPNLVGSQLDFDRGNYITYDLGWKAAIDSFLEYLLKVPLYDPQADSRYLTFWYDAVQSSIANIALSPYNAPDLTYLSQADDCGSLEFSMDDYACFAGGNILLGARSHLFSQSDSDTFQNLALAVTDSCFHLYNTTASGLGPNQWAWFDTPNHTYNESWINNATYQASQHARGYFILNTEYNSFPESIESLWYAYRITGEQSYAEWNWQIFQSLMRSMDAGLGILYSGVKDVDQPAALFEPELPSFYFAEVLKYLYLTFTDADVISLDEWVFNTEAHPFRIGGGCKKSAA